MTRLTRRARRLAVAAAGLAAACALAFPAAAANASTVSYTPNPHQWYFSKWGVQQDGWSVTEGAGVTVADVGSGVQSSLPDLQGVVKPGADMLGGSGKGETDYAKNGGHGTEMAELIAGQGIGGGSSGVAPVGIAPKAKILPVHASDPADSTGAVIKGIKYAVDHGAKIVNLSLGFSSASQASCDPQLQDAVSYALEHDVVVVAASGDTNLGGTGPEQPGTCAGVLAVGGVEENDSLWQDSTQGSYVSVAAPGDDIYIVDTTGQRYSTTGSGTSDSSALVSGIAALIRSAYPSMPWYTVDQRLIDTAVPTGSVPNDGTGYGIVDLNKALHVSRYPVPASAPNPPYTRYENWLKSSDQSSDGTGGQAAPSATASPGSSGITPMTLIITVLIVLVIVAVIVIVAVTTSRSRRRGRRGPMPPGGYPANGYAPPPAPGQYPPGAYPPPGPYPQQPQYPPPGQYPPGQQYTPPQYPPPGGKPPPPPQQ